MNPLLLWLESSAFSIWMRESPSIFGFPGILAAHTIGLGLLGGLSVALDLRVLGVAPGMPANVFRRFVPMMWVGFWINLLSGLALLMAYPAKALTNPVFYLKLALIATSIILLVVILRRTVVPVAAGEGRRLKLLAGASLVVWAAATTAGRLLAYTCTWLMVGEPCL